MNARRLSVFALFVIVVVHATPVLAQVVNCSATSANKCTKIDRECSTADDCANNIGESRCFDGYCHLDETAKLEYDRNKTSFVWGLIDFQNDLGITLKKPVLEIKIPGLEFSDVKQTLDNEGYINIPYLGEFITALYKYGIALASIIAVVLIIKNGVTIILSAGGEEKMSSYHQIGQIMIGLIILWGSYAFLYTISPNLVQFKPLRIKYIKTRNLVEIDAKTFTKLTKEAIRSKKELVAMAVNAGIKVGFSNPCFMKAIMSQESGAKADVVGHDENYNGRVTVNARRNFLLSGIKFSRKTFTPPVENKNDYVPTVHNSTETFNDDILTEESPDYGLDWRSSHGFGLGQITLKPIDFCDATTRGKSINGVCYTIPALLTPSKNLDFTSALFRENYDCVDRLGLNAEDRARAAFYAYNAGCSRARSTAIETIRANAYVVSIMNYYTACSADPTTDVYEADDFVPQNLED